MKSSKKFIVTALSTALGLGIVGSITGTIAWYQYSTRSTAAFIGTSVKSTANLEVSVDGTHFYSRLTSSQINAQLASEACKNAFLSPVTTGADTAADDALPAKFYTNPAYQDFQYDSDNEHGIRGWGTAKAIEYVQFTLTLRYTGVSNGTAASGIEGKKIYLNDLLIDENSGNTKKNISDAVRVHLDSTNDMYLSNNGQATVLGGKLDMNRDGMLDTDGKWIEDFGAGSEQNYGDVSFTQNTYKLSDVKPTLENDLYTGTYYLGETDNNGKLEVKVTIWVEGWQKLYNTVTGLVVDSSDVVGLYTKNAAGEYEEVTTAGSKAESGVTYYKLSADWSEDDYVNALFNVGLEFVVDRI